MRSNCVVFYGNFSAERISLEGLGKEVNWRICRIRSLDEIRSLSGDAEIIAVFADYEESADFGGIREYVPDARLVVCYPLRMTLAPEELLALGAFHSIPRPLDDSEVRQSLGFIWEAWTRRSRRPQRVAVSAA